MRMVPHLRYLKYLLKHKYFYDWYQENNEQMILHPFVRRRVEWFLEDEMLASI